MDEGITLWTPARPTTLGISAELPSLSPNRKESI